jgi:hypothetical protein
METTKWLPTIEGDYQDFPALSNSLLKALRKSGLHFLKMREYGYPDDKKPHHLTGQLVDSYLLSPKTFDQEYILQSWQTPGSPQQHGFVDALLAGEDVEEAYSGNYKKKLKPETLTNEANALRDSLHGYIQYMKHSAHKQTYTEKDKEYLQDVIKAVSRHPLASKMLLEESPKLLKQTHVQLTAEIFGEAFKGELDLAIASPSYYWSVDVKTTSKPISEFVYQYTRYGYDKQQFIYYKLLRAKAPENLPIRTAVIVVTTKSPIECWVFEVHPRVLVQAKNKVADDIRLYREYKDTNFVFPKRTIATGMELITPYGIDLSILGEETNE